MPYESKAINLKANLRWEQYAPGPVREVVIKGGHKHSKQEHADGDAEEDGCKPDKRKALGTEAPKEKKAKKHRGTDEAKVNPAPDTVPEVSLPPDDNGRAESLAGPLPEPAARPSPVPGAPEEPEAAAAPAAEDGAPAEVWDPSSHSYITVDTLGCPKCRHSRLCGCAQCQELGFRQRRIARLQKASAKDEPSKTKSSGRGRGRGRGRGHGPK